MKRHKNHARLVDDCAKLMGTSYFNVIWCAVGTANVMETTREDKNVAQRLLDTFVETNVVPEYVEDFMIDILTCRRVLTNEEHKLLNFGAMERSFK